MDIKATGKPGNGCLLSTSFLIKMKMSEKKTFNNNNNNNNISIAQLEYTYDQMRFTIHSRNQIESNVGFRGERKTGEPGEKPLGSE